MALYHNLCKTYKTLLLPSYVLVKHIHKNIESRTVILEIDAIDDFTTQLLQRQNSKWENLQAKSKELCKQQKNMPNVSIAQKEVTNKADSWVVAVEQKNVNYVLDLVEFCVRNNTVPPKHLTSAAVQILAENGKHVAILQIKRLCETHCPELLRLNANFDVHLAEAFWNHGDVNKSLTLFTDIYTRSKALQRQVNTTLKYLFLNIIKNRGEAVLLAVIKFCESLHKNHQDVFLLALVWQMCFLSEWFSDQNVAFDLIEQNTELRKVVLLRVPFLASLALNNHQTDLVYRLLEFLLKHELKIEYSSVLQCLFDYKSMLSYFLIVISYNFFSINFSSAEGCTWLL